MKCKNCGKNEANFVYTKIVNGDKQELVLCEECAKKFGLDNIDLDFNMPIHFSNFLSDFWNDSDELFLNPFKEKDDYRCNSCGMTFDEFLNKGKFGCSNCYDTFENKLDEVIKQIHGAQNHIGRKAKLLEGIKEEKEKIAEKIKDAKDKKAEKIAEKEEAKAEQSEEKDKIKELKKELNKAIAEERYEDAAKFRDEIKALQEKK